MADHMYTQLSQCIQNIVSVTQKELTIILSCFKPLHPERNEILINTGQRNQRMFFICKGCLRIFFVQEDGQEATRYLAFENKFATALSSFITEEPSLECIQAFRDTVVLYISRKEFYDLLETIPLWEKFYRNYLEVAYLHNTHRLMSFITMDAAERYRQLLAENPVIVQRLPNKVVASYLNISQETLSRIKSKL